MVPQLISELWARMAFYPTLLHTITMSKYGGREWYTRIDDTVILGALPLKNKAKQLVDEENVRGLITLNQRHETKHLTYTTEEWRMLGVDQLWISLVDFVGAPTAGQIETALTFIQKHKDQGTSVYIHCKAGRTRSATLVACYLMQINSWKPETAVKYIKEKRPHILLMTNQWKCLQQFYDAEK